ncbi:MAG: glycosyltransferase [Finegoldia sp.]|nr:glycosyltransferase [Finegoldia sp.]
MEKKRYTFLVNFTPPPRLTKRMDLLRDDFNISAICWDKGGDDKFDFKRDFVENHIIRVKADRTNPLKRIGATEDFSKKAYGRLTDIRPDLIHIQSYDMLRIAYKYKKKEDDQVKIIYEVPDIHRYLTDEKHKFPINIISPYMRKDERKMLDAVDLMVLTSMKFFDHFEGYFDKENVVFMPNIPNLKVFENYKELREKNSDRPFTVGYIGGIRYAEEMKRLLKAMDHMEGVRLLLAGFESGDYFKNEAAKRDYVEYRGKFYYDEEVADLYSRCDVIFSVYNASMRNVRIALPNKLYEAVHTEVPIIAARDTYLCELVKEWGVGVCVDHESVEEMYRVILRLRDDKEFYRSLKENCKNMQEELDPEKNNQVLLNKIKALF